MNPSLSVKLFRRKESFNLFPVGFLYVFRTCDKCSPIFTDNNLTGALIYSIFVTVLQNIVANIHDNAHILITIGSDVSRSGDIYCDDPIIPMLRPQTPLKVL